MGSVTTETYNPSLREPGLPGAGGRVASSQAGAIKRSEVAPMELSENSSCSPLGGNLALMWSLKRDFVVRLDQQLIWLKACSVLGGTTKLALDPCEDFMKNYEDIGASGGTSSGTNAVSSFTAKSLSFGQQRRKFILY